MWLGLVLGPCIAIVALVALWKNETRFDYARAAELTHPLSELNASHRGEVISLTGSMDQQLTFPGEYVEAFTGRLVVWRDAQIYAWREDSDDDGNTTWSMTWMNNLERNSRNSGIVQRLSSKQIMPVKFVVGQLSVEKELVEFVDPVSKLDARTLTLSQGGKSLGLRLREGEFYLTKGGAPRLGDERVQFSGIVVPETATYFGKFDGERGIADQQNQQTGFFSSLIRDSGILHHLVAGDREDAIASMKSHIGRLKWMYRGVGSAGVVFGLLCLMSTIMGFLFHVPVIGSIAQSGVLVLSLAVGLPLAALTIITGYLASKPIVLLVVLLVVAAAILFVVMRGATSQASFKEKLESRYGRQLNEIDFAEMEFIELVLLAHVDSTIEPGEEKLLRQWAKRQRWDEEKYNKMLKRAKDGLPDGNDTHVSREHLENLMRLALADGSLSSNEVSAIKQIAHRVGYKNAELNEMMRRLRNGSEPASE